MRALLLWTLICTVGLTYGASKYYDGETRPYEFGYSIERHQHRHEKKDEQGLIMGEFGFITGDGVYHVTVYATDENGNFKIVSMKNVKVGLPGDPELENVPSNPKQYSPTAKSVQSDIKQSKPSNTPACSACVIPEVEEKQNNEQIPVTPETKNVVGIDVRQGRILSNGNNKDSRINEARKQQTPDDEEDKIALDPTAVNPESPLFRPLSKQLDDGLLAPEISEKNSEGQPKHGNQIQPSHNQHDQSQEGNKLNSPNQIGKSNKNSIQNINQNTKPNQSSVNNQISGIATILPQTSDQQNPTSQPDQVNEKHSVVLNPGQQPSGKSVNSKESSPKINPVQQPSIKPENTFKQKDLAQMQKMLMGILYRYNYTVGYDDGSTHGHNEEGDHIGNKDGSYFFDGRDGLRRNVEYKANEFGFQPHLKLQKIDAQNVPKDGTGKEAGLKGYEFKWFNVDNKN